MFELKIDSHSVIFSKFFSEADRNIASSAVVASKPWRVVFIDTPSTQHLVDTITDLLVIGDLVIVRDHHDVTDAEVVKGGRPAETRAAVERVRLLIGNNATISNRALNPACSSLIEAREFIEGSGTVIVADPDPDGLLGAMKALGVTYPELDADAAILDGPRAQQKGLSPLGELLAKGMATLPPFNPANPGPSERAKGELFNQFVAAVQGSTAARADLEKKVEVYEQGVAIAKELAAAAVEVVPGVWQADSTKTGRFDLGTLAAILEARPGCVVTVVRKPEGPLAAQAKENGQEPVQYSLAVPRAKQSEVNIQVFMPEGFVSSPETGVICNTPFLAHVSERVWQDAVLPALRARFSPVVV